MQTSTAHQLPSNETVIAVPAATGQLTSRDASPPSDRAIRFDPPESRSSPADGAEATNPGPRPLRERPLLLTTLFVAGLALAAAGGAYWLHARHFEGTDDAFIDGHTAQIAPKISGYVTKLLIADNEMVHAGDLLLEIDPRDYQLALEQAKAAEATALGRLAQAEAQEAAAEAQAAGAKQDVLAAQATAENSALDMERNKKLAPKGAVSQQSLDASIATARANAAQLLAATARATAAESQIKLAESQRVTAEAEIAEARVRIATAELNHSYCRIVAPITGRVTHRTVELGDYLTVGQPLFALVDPNVWVTANFKETQLTHMCVGQPVEVTVDAFPGRTLHARVDGFQRGSGARFSLLPAENATGNYVKVVQRVPVKIVFDAPPPDDMILGPGMSVEPRVTVR